MPDFNQYIHNITLEDADKYADFMETVFGVAIYFDGDSVSIKNTF